MPVSSIQYRGVTEKYQNQAYLSKEKKIRITKGENTSKSYELKKIISCLETKISSASLKDKKFKQISSKTQNTIKTSLVLFLLLNLINSQANATDIVDFKFNSLTVEPNIILPITIDPANTLIDYSISDDVSIYQSQSSEESLKKTKDARQDNSLNKVIRKENKKIFSFLKKQGVLDKNKKPTKEELILVVYNYCFNNNFHNSRQIARRILSASRPYKSERHEVLSNRQIETIISHWIFENILDTSLEGYLAKIIATDENPLDFTINDIIRVLSIEELEKRGMLNLNTLSPEIRLDFNAMWQSYLRKEMPFFYFYDEDESIGVILLDDIQFSNLYTGSRYLSELNGITHFNKSEVLELGEKIWEQAIVEGITVAMEPYFFVPSLFFEAQNNPQKISRIENVHDISEIIITEELKYREMTQQIYKRMEDKLKTYKTVLHQWHKIKENPQTTNEEIAKITTEVIDRFFELDEYLIFSALNSIGNYEIEFIFSSDAIIRPISLSLYKKNRIITPFYGSTCFNEKNLRSHCFTTSNLITLDKTDLFSVHVKGEERIYALKNEGNKYSLFRVDRDISKYIEMGILENKEIKSEHLLNNYEVKIGVQKFSFYFDTASSPIKEKGESIIKFIDFLRNLHRDNLNTSLYKLNKPESTFQTLWSIFKHFIPFYDCIDGIANADLLQSVVSCSLDSIIIAPLIADSISISEKFSLKFAKRMRVSEISLTNAFAFKEKVDLPKVSALSLLREHTLKILHPKFRLLGTISSKYINQLIKFLKEDMKTVAIAEKLNSLILRKQKSHFPQSYITARLPDSEIRVPVRRVGENDGQDLYAIVNPDTGETAWARFIIKENNQLISLDTIPEISISKALENLIVPDMYVNELDIEKLSTPDYMGLRWDDNHVNAYIKFKGKLLRIKIIDNQPFLLSRGYNIPLVIKDHKLKPEGLLHRLNRLKKVGLGGKNLTPKQIIANKLNISEEQAADLLNRYHFPKDSNYYSDETFSLWIKETGQIPKWAEAFQILNRNTYVSRFRNVEIQSNDLYSFSGGEGFVYRADETHPDSVLTQGFRSSEDYTAIEKMIPDSELGLIVSGDIIGVLRYNELAKSPYIYKIKLENIRGVSLHDNLMRNEEGLKIFFGEDADASYETLESVAPDSNGAIYLNEVHLYNSDVKPEYISIVTKEEIEQVKPLSDGLWKNYLL